jgi:hypothetical protein
MIKVMYIVCGSGLDAFLAYELELAPMNMNEISKIINEMGLNEYPLKIIVLNNPKDKTGIEYVYNLDWCKYSRITLEDEDDLRPKAKQ